LAWDYYEVEGRKRKRFVDLIHDGTGRLVRLVFNEDTKQFEIEPIEEERAR